MNRMSRRRVSRLEKRMVPSIAKTRRSEAENAAWQRQAARDHATKLVTLILHGDPQIEEPLAIAWRRALGRLGLVGIAEAQLADRLRALVIAGLPGDTENAKFAHVLCSAPQWLLAFCLAWADDCILGIDLPKSSEPPTKLGRKALRDCLDSWPDLPVSTLGAGGPIPKLAPSPLSSPLDALSFEEIVDLRGLVEKGEENWSRRDYRRYTEITAKVDMDDLFPEWLITGEGDPDWATVQE
jgi:hypothetical protein